LTETNASQKDGWLSFEEVPLKWHLPAGLLYDLYSGTSGHSQDNNDKGNTHSALEYDDRIVESSPWKLTLHFTNWPSEQLTKLDGEGKVLQDAFMNSVKEASHVRHDTGQVVMSLGKDESIQLWTAVEKNDLNLFNTMNKKLLRPPGVPLRHIPLKVYLPSAAPSGSASMPSVGHMKVVQSLITPNMSSRQSQTLGMALNSLLPTLFPSRRSPLLALPVLHGAVVPLGVGLEELAEFCAYADGFLHIAVVMMG
jgi:autophagy-related protein 5